MDFQTFLVYTFLMTFCVGAGYMLALCPINKVNQEGRVERNRLYQAIVFSIILVYVVIVGFRYNVGVDYKNYLGWYNIYFRTGKYPVKDMDSSFLFINYVVKELNIHFSFIFCFLAYILIYAILRGVRYMKFLYAFFFFTIIFNESMNVMRQIAAFFLCFCSFSLYFEGNKKRSLIIGIMAVLTHKSSLAALAWIPFLKIDAFKNRKITAFFLVVTFLMGISLYDYLKVVFVFVAPFFGNRLGGYADEWSMEQFEEHTAAASGEGIAVVIYLFINLLIVRYSTKLRQIYKDYHFSFYYNIFIIGQMLNHICSLNTIFIRANYCFSLYNIVVLSFFCHYLLVKNKTSVLEKLCGMGIIVVYFLLHYRHIIQNDSINPYKSILL